MGAVESVRTERWSQLLWWMSPMNCPHCQASQPRKLDKTTDLGYALFHCRRCKRKFNERTCSPFNYLEFPTDIVFQVVLCRLRYKLSLRDLAEMFFAKRYGNGKSALHRCSPSTCVETQG